MSSAESTKKASSILDKQGLGEGKMEAQANLTWPGWGERTEKKLLGSLNFRQLLYI